MSPRVITVADGKRVSCRYRWNGKRVSHKAWKRHRKLARKADKKSSKEAEEENVQHLRISLKAVAKRISKRTALCSRTRALKEAAWKKHNHLFVRPTEEFFSHAHCVLKRDGMPVRC
jgi:hypothetical protein